MHETKRVLISENPFTSTPASETKWVHCAEAGQPPFVTAYRRRFEVTQAARVRVHVSADERYDLFLDGKRIGRGSERGTELCWFFETYDLALSKGSHVLVARVWSLGELAPEAQRTFRPGFLLSADGDYNAVLSTGVAPWEAKKLAGYAFDMSYGFGGHYFVIGCRFEIDAEHLAWEALRGEGSDWQPAVADFVAGPQLPVYGEGFRQEIRPATLPPMLEVWHTIGKAVFISAPASTEVRTVPVRQADSLAREIKPWNALLRGAGTVTIPPRTRRRVIIDLDEYYCAYPELTTNGGRGSRVRLSWAEALFCEAEGRTKGNRDEIEGKFFLGIGDLFKPDGGARRTFEPLWWNAGRYLELLIETAAEPLTINQLRLRETRYPFEMESEFAASDKRLERVIPIARRGLQMCSHETYMDCPHYEQMMYLGDTRLEALTTLALTNDDRLPRKALQLFHVSQQPNGLTQSRFPTRTRHIIPPFSLWWVAMVHDYALWRNDRRFVAGLMPGVRSVIEAFLSFRNADGLIQGPPGWNFMDWVPAWYRGTPPDARFGVSASVNWQTVLVLTQAAQLEQWMGEPALAARDQSHAQALAAKLQQTFWNQRRGLFTDDVAQKHFSEHTQCLALLSGLVEPAKEKMMAKSLLKDRALERTTIYFTHYLFETYRRLGAMDAFFKRMGLWFDLEKQGAKTTVESPEPTRSDCHAWGAHPLFHYFATILGIRPGEFGFKTVRIEPQLGRLKSARGNLVHPAGRIAVDFQLQGQRLRGSVTLPRGVNGSLAYGGQTVPLRSGRQTIAVSANGHPPLPAA